MNYGRENKNTIFEDKQGTLWLIPHNGNFCYYDRKNKELKAFYTDPDNPQSLFAPLEEQMPDMPPMCPSKWGQ